MPFTPEQKTQFEQLTRPLIHWINENADPHHTVIITPTSAELLSGEIALQTEEYVHD